MVHRIQITKMWPIKWYDEVFQMLERQQKIKETRLNHIKWQSLISSFIQYRY